MNIRELFNPILCGVDALGLSTPAVVRTLLLAQKLDARASLIHAIEARPPRWPALSEEDLKEHELAETLRARRQLLHVVERARLEAKYTERTSHDLLSQKAGHAAEVILREAERLEAGLILLGPHVKRSVMDFGGTARAVLAHSRVPVWVQAHEVETIQRILVAVDFSEHSRRAMELAISIAHLFGASLRVLHAHAPPTVTYDVTFENSQGPTFVIEQERAAVVQELEEWMNSFDLTGISADSSFVEFPAVPSICEASEEADLLIMGTHGRTGLTRLLLGSVAYAALKRTETPVLIVPADKETWLLAEDPAEPARRTQTVPAF